MASASPSSHYVGLRLRALIWSCLDCDLVRSAVFFAERYYCIDPDNHQARHLYASALLRAGHTHSALHRVQDQSCLGCTEVYSRCCNALGRFREGEEALRRCMGKGDSAIALEAATFQEARQFPDAAVLACRAGTMAMKGNLTREAIAHFNRALAINPFMWEAIEGLCQLGSFFEVNEVLPSRGSFSKDGPSVKPPSAGTATTSTSLFTPDAMVNGNNGAPKMQANGLLPFKLNGAAAARDSIGSIADSSFGEYNSPGFRPRVFTAEMMLTNARPPAAAVNDGRPATKRARGEMLSARTESEGNRLAGTRTTATSVANGKRARDVSLNSPLSPFSPNTVLLQPAVPRAVPEHVREPTRRSTRSSAAAKGNAISKAREIKRGPRGISGAAAVAKTASPSSDDEMMSVDTNASAISALDTGDISRWEIAQQHLAEQQAVAEADAYILELVRIFSRAVQAMARFQCEEVIEQLDLLPLEQQYSPTVMTLLGRAFFEMLDYVKAERCFATAREYDPYRHQDMDLYSTLLWHMSRPTLLSFLSQELLTMDNTSPPAWIAAGNCFSLQKEHNQALSCFRRATQLDPRCAYAYNLSGHESIAIDESHQAIDFFRQGLKIDSRHYPAWYGLGMVYYRSSRYDEAQWHFRKAIEINPCNAVLVCCEGMVYEQRKNWPAALEVYNRAVLLAPNSSLVLFKRVRMLVECGQYEESRDILLRLLDAIPEEVNVPFMLAQVYTRLGQSALSAKYMAVAQDIEPKIASTIRMIQAQRGAGKIVLDATGPVRNLQEQQSSMDEGG